MSNSSQTDWFTTPLGERLLAVEAELTAQMLAQAFGYFLVQLGQWGQPDFQLAGARTQRRVTVGWPGSGGAADVWSAPTRLSFGSDSVDALVLPHTLEFVARPHQLLREAERILVAEGKLLILGFNPWSLLGLRRLPGMRKRFPWNGTLLSERRLRDWLALLGLEVVASDRYFFRPPLSLARSLDKLAFMERLGARYWPACSGGYALLARKRVLALPHRMPKARQQHAIDAVAKPV